LFQKNLQGSLYTCDVILNKVQLPWNMQHFYCIGVYTKLNSNQNVYCSVHVVTFFSFLGGLDEVAVLLSCVALFGIVILSYLMTYLIFLGVKSSKYLVVWQGTST